MRCFSLNSTVKLRVLFYNDCKEASNATNITLTVTKPDTTSIAINGGFVNFSVQQNLNFALALQPVPKNPCLTNVITL